MKSIALLAFLSVVADAFSPSTPRTLSEKRQDDALTVRKLDPFGLIPITVVVAGIAGSIYADTKPEAFEKLTEKLSELNADDGEKDEYASGSTVVSMDQVSQSAPETKPVVPEPVPIPAPEAVDESPSSDPVRAVASTIDTAREMEERLEAKEAKTALPAAPLELETPVEEETEEKVEKISEEKPRIRKISRVVKKVIAPWRKWENIK